MSHYGISKQVDFSFEEAVEKVRGLISGKNFSVVCEIPVSEKVKVATGKEMDEYIILGACNPKFAARAITAEQEIGLLLPCNIIIYKKDGLVFVSALKPSVAMSFIDNSELHELSSEIESLLTQIIKEL